ncbi:CotO family spore coat protein [Oceanobacillus sp. CAU 1775]
MPNDKYAKAPKLYIHQNNLKEVKANMQHNYRSSKSKEASEENVGSEERSERRIITRRRTRADYDDEPTNDQTDEIIKDNIEKVEEPQEEKERKSFSEMTIQEKLIRLTNKSEFAPKLNCMIKTEDKTYRGIILSYENEEVIIQSGRRGIKLHENDIKTIQILSL